MRGGGSGNASNQPTDRTNRATKQIHLFTVVLQEPGNLLGHGVVDLVPWVQVVEPEVVVDGDAAGGVEGIPRGSSTVDHPPVSLLLPT